MTLIRPTAVGRSGPWHPRSAGPRPVRAVVIPVLLVLALLGAGTARRAAATPLPSAVGVTDVVVNDCLTGGRTVPSGYLGLSIEWSSVAHWFGTSGTGAVQPMVELLRSLQSSPDAAGVLRIGGNSQDGYTWAPDDSLTGNTLFTGKINHGLVDAVLEVAQQSGWKVVFGLNLRNDQPAQAVALARYAVSHDVGHTILAFELGNEPNSYFGTDTAGYLARFGTYAEALRADPVTQTAGLAGPSLSNEADLSYVSQLSQSFGTQLAFTTWHHYANRPTLTDLLDPSVTTHWTDRIDAATQASGGLPTRMDEGNSVGHGGLNGVSNVMGTTAWLVDTLLSGAAEGLGGYNVHAWDGFYYPAAKFTSFYTPFVVRGGVVTARPTFYALALLRDLAGKRFCRTVTTAPSPDAVKGWGLVDPVTGHLYVYVVDKAAHSASVLITPPAGYGGDGALSQISDSGGCAGKHTSIEGAVLPRDGGYRWAARSVRPSQPTGNYGIHLGPCQSALLDIAATELPPPVG